MKEFLGQTGFIWWHGVVEDTSDPLFLGRCRVRVFGYHSTDLKELPVAALPWAYPMQPITSAALSGIGTSPTGLLVGSHVFGFFRDGTEAQDPIIIGSFGGIPQSGAIRDRGFNNPNGTYPVTELDVAQGIVPKGCSIAGEQDTNRLARNDGSGLFGGTVVDFKNYSRKEGIISVPDMANGKIWSEPRTPFDPVYPKNHVRFTESGHIEEFDDTPGHERIHQYHTSGTFVEIGNGYTAPPKAYVPPDGTRVQRIVGDDYEICYGNKKIYVAGSEGVDLVVSGGINITVNGGGNIQLNGEVNILAKGDINLKVDGNLKASGKQMEFFAEENIAFSGKVVSFISNGSVMNVGQRIEVNSGPPVVHPKTVKV